MCPHNICATFLPSLVLLPKNNSKTCLIFRLQTTLKSLLFMNPFLLIKKNPKLSDNLSIHVRNHKNNIFRNLMLEFLLFHLKMSSNLPELVGGFIPEYAKVQPAFIRTLADKVDSRKVPCKSNNAVKKLRKNPAEITPLNYRVITFLFMSLKLNLR